MSTIDNKSSAVTKGQQKKASKRKRQLLKKKLEKIKSTKVKRKRLPKKKDSTKLQKKEDPLASDNLNDTTTSSAGSKTKKTQKRSHITISVNNGNQTIAVKRKKIKSASSKTIAGNTTKVDIKKQSADVTPEEPEVRPDKNWNELSKKLGIKTKCVPSPINANNVSSAVDPDVSSKEKWFDDVDEILIERPKVETLTNGKDKSGDIGDRFITPGTKPVLTKCLAMDCEMVGVGPTGEESVLARISVVNQHGHCVYDKFVKAKENVTDYRTWVSGVRPEDLENAEDLETVQKEVDDMFKGRILVGHAITNDEKVLFMNHPKKYVRDTQKYPGFRQLVGGRKPGLKQLTQRVLGVKIQTGEHSSVQDAQATMRLYTMIREMWEKSLREKRMLNKHIKKTGAKKSKKPEENVTAQQLVAA